MLTNGELTCFTVFCLFLGGPTEGNGHEKACKVGLSNTNQIILPECTTLPLVPDVHVIRYLLNFEKRVNCLWIILI